MSTNIFDRSAALIALLALMYFAVLLYIAATGVAAFASTAPSGTTGTHNYAIFKRCRAATWHSL